MGRNGLPWWTREDSNLRHQVEESFAHLWNQVSDDERAAQGTRRWAVLTPVTDSATKLVADLAAGIDGPRVSYLRPPHLPVLAKRVAENNPEALEVPALFEWGPAGPTDLLIIEINACTVYSYRFLAAQSFPTCQHGETDTQPLGHLATMGLAGFQ